MITLSTGPASSVLSAPGAPRSPRGPEAGSWLAVLEGIRDGTMEAPPATGLIGLELLQVGGGRAVFRFTPRPDHGNPTHVHGGVLAAVADAALSTAVAAVLPPGGDLVTADLHVSYLRPVGLDDPPLTATGTVLHAGRTQANAEATVVAPDGTRVVHAIGTFRLFPPR